MATALQEMASLNVIEVDPAALQNLDAALWVARALRDQPASPARRAALVRVLTACRALIQSWPEWHEAGLEVPLVEAITALEALDQGQVLPILKPNKKGGRPTSVIDAATRGLAAGAMGGLMKHGGMKKTAAAAWVAERFAAGGWSRITATTVANWRKEALESPGDRAGQNYANAMQGMNWDDPKAAAGRLLQRLMDVAPKK